jgi:hypothetical protein
MLGSTLFPRVRVAPAAQAQVQRSPHSGGPSTAKCTVTTALARLELEHTECVNNKKSAVC